MNRMYTLINLNGVWFVSHITLCVYPIHLSARLYFVLHKYTHSICMFVILPLLLFNFAIENPANKIKWSVWKRENGRREERNEHNESKLKQKL